MLKFEVDEHTGTVSLFPDGPLAAQNFRAVSDAISPQVNRAGRLTGLIIQADDFPAWRDLSEFLTCMRFLHEHGDTLRRVAAITNTPAASFMPQMQAHFSQAVVRHFSLEVERRARVWVHDAITEDPEPQPVPDSVDEVIDDGRGTEPEPAVVVVDEIDAEGTAEEDDWFV